jgi:tRNA threonylcarbamoyladenosine biosynthesis protein TsaE
MRQPARGVFLLACEADTARLGAAVAGALRAGEAVCLTGVLGAGKSVLARSLIRTLAPGERDVPSPTFTLVQTYVGERLRIAHFDLYRLEDAAEAWELGLEEALSEGAAVIEWPERLGSHPPVDRLDIEITVRGGPGEDQSFVREARITPHGAWKRRAIDL